MSDKISTPKEYYGYTALFYRRCDDIYLRHKFLKAELEKIFDLTTGRSTPLADFITDKSGNVSEKKIQTLINRLMECYNEEQVSFVPKFEKEKKGCKEFYRCFLYCAIKGFSAEIQLEFRKTQTFGDIIRMAAGTKTNVADILENEFSFIHLAFPDCSGFFGNMCYAYKLITGKNIFDDFSAEQRAVIKDSIQKYEKYQRENHEWEKSYRTREDGTYMTDEEYKEMLDLEAQACSDFQYTPEDQKLIDEEDKLKKEAKDAQSEWLNSFKNAEKFIRCYKRARELYFKYSASLNPEQEITDMIDCFLCINGLSDLSDEDTAVKAIYRVRRAQEAIEHSRKKRGIHNG
ncbi:MAG: hypothetical protein ACI4KM_04780 [Oscillospiraceae bacterium]